MAQSAKPSAAIATPAVGSSVTGSSAVKVGYWMFHTSRAIVVHGERVLAEGTRVSGVVTSAVNIPAIPAEDMEVLGPFVPLCRALGRIAIELLRGSSVDRTPPARPRQ